MVSVLCVAGLDPSGHAGLSADIRALEYLGIKTLPIASVLTVQNMNSFTEFQPVSIELIKKQFAAIMEDEKPLAAKLGILGTAELASFISQALSETNIPFFVTPDTLPSNTFPTLSFMYSTCLNFIESRSALTASTSRWLAVSAIFL